MQPKSDLMLHFSIALYYCTVLSKVKHCSTELVPNRQLVSATRQLYLGQQYLCMFSAVVVHLSAVFRPLDHYAPRHSFGHSITRHFFGRLAPQPSLPSRPLDPLLARKHQLSKYACTCAYIAIFQRKYSQTKKDQWGQLSWHRSVEVVY